MSKPRSDAKLLNLPEADQDRICAWLTEGVEGDTSYATVAAQIAAEFNIKVSKSAVAEFWNKNVAPMRLLKSKQAALNLAETARGSGVAFEEAALAALQQQAFEMLAQGSADPKAVQVLFGLMLENQKLALKKEEVAIQKGKFQRETCKLFLAWCEDQKAKAIANGSGSNAEKIEQLGKAMFGEDWED